MVPLTPDSLLMRSFEQDTKNTERAQMIWTFRDEFLARSTRRDSATLAPVDQVRSPVIAPTDDEYAAYVDPVSSKRWLAIPSDWACPICARSKRQLMRKSKSGRWSGGVRSLYECTLERDDLTIANRQRLFPDFRNDIFVRDISQITVCADCAEISSPLMQKDQSIRDPYLEKRETAAHLSLTANPTARMRSILKRRGNARSQTILMRPHRQLSMLFGNVYAILPGGSSAGVAGEYGERAA